MIVTLVAQMVVMMVAMMVVVVLMMLVLMMMVVMTVICTTFRNQYNRWQKYLLLEVRCSLVLVSCCLEQTEIK